MKTGVDGVKIASVIPGIVKRAGLEDFINYSI